MSKPGCSAEVIEAFAALVRPEIEDERIDLLRAALSFARIEYPQLDVELYVKRFHELAVRVAARIPETGDPAQSVAALNQVLFLEEMFRGTCFRSRAARNHQISRRTHSGICDADALGPLATQWPGVPRLHSRQ